MAFVNGLERLYKCPKNKQNELKPMEIRISTPTNFELKVKKEYESIVGKIVSMREFREAALIRGLQSIDADFKQMIESPTRKHMRHHGIRFVE
jgi:hypothetical protein